MSATIAKRILVCDEDFRAALQVREHFEGMGCAVSLARDLSQASDSLGRDAYDLVILDLFLAKTNGQSLKVGGAKLAFVSSEDDGDQVRYSRSSGADYYLAKPFENSDLARLAAIL